MTYFYKVVKVDLDAERARIKRVRYSAAEKTFLRAICDYVEQHDLMGAARLCSLAKRQKHKAWFEFIGEEIWSLLWNMALEHARLPGRAELEKLWKKRDKKGLPT